MTSLTARTRSRGGWSASGLTRAAARSPKRASVSRVGAGSSWGYSRRAISSAASVSDIAGSASRSISRVRMSSNRLNVTARPPSPQSLDECEGNVTDGGHDGDGAGQLVRLVVRRHGNARHAGGDGRLDAPARVFDGDGAMRI